LSDTNSAFESSQKRLELMSKKVDKLVDYSDDNEKTALLDKEIEP